MVDRRGRDARRLGQAGRCTRFDLAAQRRALAVGNRRHVRRGRAAACGDRRELGRPDEAAAREVADEVATRHGLPTYLYEEAAATPARRNLEDIRRGEFEGLAAKIATPEWAPDFGPATAHPSAGASVIGARMPLIAYNINLATDRLDVAKKIAAAVRHSTGGLRYVKAMGLPLEDRGIVQVSMNLTNFEKTPIYRVFELVKREAARYGVNVLESEIIGLVPSAALTQSAAWFLQVSDFTDAQVLENALNSSII